MQDRESLDPAARRAQFRSREEDGSPLFATVSRARNRTRTPAILPGLECVGLFAGIGGIELGLSKAGHHTALLCENEPTALRVLKQRFPRTAFAEDVRTLQKLPSKTQLLAAGFPCQDLSQAGALAGIRGKRSGLVSEVFRLIDESPVEWLLLENVPFMLHLQRGDAMRFISQQLLERGYRWAYRVVNALSFGIPQRRRRVLLLASKTHTPADVLLSRDTGLIPSMRIPSANGFYWTEGRTGLGWAPDAVPTLKGGSGLGIPSPPAVWRVADGTIGVPSLRDAERLQGFDADWTLPAEDGSRKSRNARWKLVGNAVSVPMAAWLGRMLRSPETYDSDDPLLKKNDTWPSAAWSDDRGNIHRSFASEWPTNDPIVPIAEFLRDPLVPLSLRALEGFWSRMKISSLRFDPSFCEAIEKAVLNARKQEKAKTPRRK